LSFMDDPMSNWGFMAVSSVSLYAIIHVIEYVIRADIQHVADRSIP